MLKALYEQGHEITGIAPPPQKRLKDKMVGYALLHGIPIVSDCEKLLSTDIPDGTELIVSAHSHWIISKQCVDKCKYGGIGFHPSLLPRHRGQDAIRWTIHMGDEITGATIYSLAGDICDGGDILLQEYIFVDREWDYHDLWRELFPQGVAMVSESVRLIESGGVSWTKQDERFATWQPSWHRDRMVRNELIALEMHDEVYC